MSSPTALFVAWSKAAENIFQGFLGDGLGWFEQGFKKGRRVWVQAKVSKSALRRSLCVICTLTALPLAIKTGLRQLLCMLCDDDVEQVQLTWREMQRFQQMHRLENPSSQPCLPSYVFMYTLHILSTLVVICHFGVLFDLFRLPCGKERVKTLF